MLVEWCPAIHNTDLKSDENDANACVEWVKSLDTKGDISSYFEPRLSNCNKALAANRR